MSEPSKSWRREYIRIILSGCGDEDFCLAKELKEAGYIEAVLAESMDRPDRSTGKVIYEGPTAKGRVFADELQVQLNNETCQYRAKLWARSAIGYFAGVVSAVLADVLVYWLTDT